jgi:hypothetical protein
VGGYNNYSYAQAQQPAAGDIGHMGGYQGDVHSQVYRPTEAEAHSHIVASKPDGKPEGKSGKMEVNVNKYLKKLDKLW